MSNIHVSAAILSTLLLPQWGKIIDLQQRNLPGILGNTLQQTTQQESSPNKAQQQQQEEEIQSVLDGYNLDIICSDIAQSTWVTAKKNLIPSQKSNSPNEKNLFCVCLKEPIL